MEALDMNDSRVTYTTKYDPVGKLTHNRTAVGLINVDKAAIAINVNSCLWRVDILAADKEGIEAHRRAPSTNMTVSLTLAKVRHMQYSKLHEER
jgi:hypothetical protein